MAGTAAALDTGNSAAVGCTYRSDGTTGDFCKGLLLGVACSSGTLGAAEIPGVSQWAVNLAAQQQTLTGWLGVGFQGSAMSGEPGAAHAAVVKRFDAAITKSEYVPSSFPDLRTVITGTSTGIYADMGIATDGVSYYYTFDGFYSGTQVLYKFDGFKFTLLSTFSVSGGTSTGNYGIGLTFARNIDNTIYTDAYGRAYLFFDGNPGSGNQIAYTRSVDNTWSTGGAWGPAQVVSGFLPGAANVNQIDPTVMIDAAGVWHMAFSDYYPPAATVQQGGVLRHAKCVNPTPDGLWTLDNNVDVYGQGLGVEGPQFLNLGTAAAPQFALACDRTGCGTHIVALPNGLGAAGGVRNNIQSDDIIEHGEFAPWIPGFPTPTLQSANAPRALKWPGKGLLTNGDVMTAASATTYAAAYGSWGTTFNKSASIAAPTISTTYVADPNGDLTATRVSFPAAPANTYNWVGNEGHEFVGASNGFASQHTVGIWMRGNAGGETVYLQTANNNAASVSYGPYTLTTSWQYFEVNALLNYNNFPVFYFGTGYQSAALGAQAIDVCWPCLK